VQYGSPVGPALDSGADKINNLLTTPQ